MCLFLALCFTGFGAFAPFFPLYMQELGVTDRAQAASLAGTASGVTLVLFAVANVVSGAVADRWGLRASLVRATVMFGIGLAIVALATAPPVAVFGRVTQGLAGGWSGIVLAYAAAIVPTAHLGSALGLVQTAQSVGNSVGPLIGGFAGDVIGFRLSFYIGGIIMALLSVAMMVFLREPPRTTRNSFSLGQGLRYVGSSREILGVMLLTVVLNAGYQAQWLLLTIGIQEIAPNPAEVGRWSGVAFLADAAGIASAAALFGRVAKRAPTYRVIALAAIGVLMAMLGHLVVRDVLLFAALRLVVGLCMGTAWPAIRLRLVEVSDPSRRALVFGVNQGMFSLSLAVGAFVGSAVIGVGGFTGVTAVGGVLVILAAALAWRGHRAATGAP
ncbi:MAG: MFS transporter [Chloroflexi bacterium]|nr:MFS transporter [Chloroflexota bacterium]